MQGILPNMCSCPTLSVHYEPMFASKKTIPARAADVLDLMIEFATLGEYGLEYPENADPIGGEHSSHPEPTRSTTRASRTCDTSPRWRCRPGHTVPSPLRTGHTPAVDCRGTSCQAGPIDYRAALRPPRIRLDSV
jgi:hypothetical protein